MEGSMSLKIKLDVCRSSCSSFEMLPPFSPVDLLGVLVFPVPPGAASSQVDREGRMSFTEVSRVKMEQVTCRIGDKTPSQRKQE